MCTLCDAGQPQDHSAPRRRFLKTTATTGLGLGAAGLFTGAQAKNDHDDDRGRPEDSGHHGRRYLIRGGAVMSISWSR